LNDRLASGGVAAAALLANALVIGILVYAAALHAHTPDLYAVAVQEDEHLEWATFWAFLAASGAFAFGAVREFRTGGTPPWFLTCLAAFCFAVAMEEISWGQRLLGYRPPTYFLEENYQQELNLHNLVAVDLRKLALRGVILGYGVALPLVARIPVAGRFLHRVAIVAPPLALTPAFLAAYVAYEWYPWRFTGEWVELMLGLGMLFSAGLHTSEVGAWGGSCMRTRRWVPVLLSTGLVLVLASATASWSRGGRSGDAGHLAAARAELEALRRDFVTARVRTPCGLHKRLYTFVEDYGVEALRAGEFSRRAVPGLTEARAEFFLDPWNLPYWLRDRCSEDGKQRRIFVYSTGPNRMRDSTPWEVLPDDVGAVLFEQRPGP
jgi:hypothetical protein